MTTRLNQRQAWQVATIDVLSRDKGKYAYYECACSKCEDRKTLANPEFVRNWLTEHNGHMTNITPRKGFIGRSLS